MKPDEIRSARQKLGLSGAQMATMLETDQQSIYRMEMDPSESTTARKPGRRIVRLLHAYMSGYRPDDWPREK